MKTRFLDLLRAAQEGSRSGVLIASLPRNDPELARAALAGGADVLKGAEIGRASCRERV